MFIDKNKRWIKSMIDTMSNSDPYWYQVKLNNKILKLDTIENKIYFKILFVGQIISETVGRAC